MIVRYVTVIDVPPSCFTVHSTENVTQLWTVDRRLLQSAEACALWAVCTVTSLGCVRCPLNN